MSEAKQASRMWTSEAEIAEIRRRRAAATDTLIAKLLKEATMEKFTNAAAVRRFIKEKGYTGKIKVRWSNNPFGGEGLFWVAITDNPPGAMIFNESGSDIPSTTYSNNAEVSKKYAKLREILTGTNARVD